MFTKLDHRVIELYKEKWSLTRIATLYGTSAPRIRRYLLKNGLRCRTTSEAASFLPAAEIIAAYVNGKSARWLAAKHNSTITSITDLLKRHKISVLVPKTNTDWSSIRFPDLFACYWLGWMLSDGYLTKKQSGGRNRGVVAGLTVHKRDRHIVEFFRAKLNRKSTLADRKTCIQLALSMPRDIAQYVHDYGLVERKSLILQPTTELLKLPEASLHQMIVGYIEGDGCVTLNGNIKICTGSKLWVEFLQRILGGKISPHNGSYNLRLCKPLSLYWLNKWHNLGVKYFLLRRKWDRILRFNGPVFFDDEDNNFREHWSKEKKHKNRPINLRASQCTIKIVASAELRQLLDTYHYLGYVSGTHNIGVYHDGVLLAALVLRKPQRQSGDDWEISRMVCNYEYRIHGLWSRCLKWCKNTIGLHGTISTFSDNRLTAGDVYSKMGMVHVNDIKSDYYWVKDGIRHHKSSLRKSAAERLTGLTEFELRSSQGFMQVWDCGKKKWSITLD